MTDLSSLRDRLVSLQTSKRGLESEVSRHKAELEKSEQDSRVYQMCQEVFKNWLEDLLDKNVQSISDLATSGLRHVIDDQDLKFSIKQEHKNNRIHMKTILEEVSAGGETIEGDPMTSYGGGAVVLISLVLRLSIMARLNMGNLLILDESMVALANAYVPNAGSFIRSLSEQTGVNILMVTHNPEYLQYAHMAYEGVKDGSLKLKTVKSELPKDTK